MLEKSVLNKLIFVEFGVGVLLKYIVAYCWICVVLLLQCDMM